MSSPDFHSIFPLLCFPFLSSLFISISWLTLLICFVWCTFSIRALNVLLIIILMICLIILAFVSYLILVPMIVLSLQSVFSLSFWHAYCLLLLLTCRHSLFSPKLFSLGTFLLAQTVKILPAIQETQIWSCIGKIPWRREWQPTPVFLPGEFHGETSLLLVLNSYYVSLKVKLLLIASQSH